jgi:hypothetical protein
VKELVSMHDRNYIAAQTCVEARAERFVPKNTRWQ